MSPGSGFIILKNRSKRNKSRRVKNYKDIFAMFHKNRRAGSGVRTSAGRRRRSLARHRDAGGSRSPAHDCIRRCGARLRGDTPVAPEGKHALRVRHRFGTQHRGVPADALSALSGARGPKQQRDHQRHHDQGRRHHARRPAAKPDVHQLEHGDPGDHARRCSPSIRPSRSPRACASAPATR